MKCGPGDIEFSVSAKDWSGAIMIGIAPTDASLGGAIYKSYGFYGYVCNKSLSTIHGEDGTSSSAFGATPWPSPLPDNSVIHVKFEQTSSSLEFSVDNGPF